jgi:GT2 family glycosyltransferase
VANTGIDFELVLESVAERRDIYRVLNNMAMRAIGDWIIPMNTDVFVSPGWSEPLVEAADLNTIISPVMVECGAIGVHERNLQRDFGMTPDAFRREEFEQWVNTGAEWLGWIDGDWAWFFPSLLPRLRFLDLGGFDTRKGSFPLEPLDIDFWLHWQAQGGKFKRVRSWVYHLQQWSSKEEQEKAVRQP